jgi:hypothetical protein
MAGWITVYNEVIGLSRNPKYVEISRAIVPPSRAFPSIFRMSLIVRYPNGNEYIFPLPSQVVNSFIANLKGHEFPPRGKYLNIDDKHYLLVQASPYSVYLFYKKKNARISVKLNLMELRTIVKIAEIRKFLFENQPKKVSDDDLSKLITDIQLSAQIATARSITPDVVTLLTSCDRETFCILYKQNLHTLTSCFGFLLPDELEEDESVLLNFDHSTMINKIVRNCLDFHNG